jgi:hypothetical protein
VSFNTFNAGFTLDTAIWEITNSPVVAFLPAPGKNNNATWLGSTVIEE